MLTPKGPPPSLWSGSTYVAWVTGEATLDATPHIEYIERLLATVTCATRDQSLAGAIVGRIAVGEDAAALALASPVRALQSAVPDAIRVLAEHTRAGRDLTDWAAAAAAAGIITCSDAPTAGSVDTPEADCVVAESDSGGDGNTSHPAGGDGGMAPVGSVSERTTYSTGQLLAIRAATKTDPPGFKLTVNIPTSEKAKKPKKKKKKDKGSTAKKPSAAEMEPAVDASPEVLVACNSGFTTQRLCRSVLCVGSQAS